MSVKNKLFWYKAQLSPAADSIFTASFYNETREVYCAINSITEAHNRVLVVSNMNESSIRLMTPHLASFCLEIHDLASELEMEELNKLTEGLLTKIGSVEV